MYNYKKAVMIQWVILIALLIAITVQLSLFRVDKEKPDSGLFRIKNTQQVNQIRLRKTNQQVELTFDDNNWYVNKKWEADRQLIKVLFAAWIQAEPKRKITGKVADSLKQKIREEGTQVTFFTPAGKVMDFYVGGNDYNETWFLHPTDHIVYQVSIPGYRVAIYTLFSLPPEEWRQKRIFHMNWKNFKHLSVSSPDTNRSFSVSFHGDHLKMSGILNADTAQLNNYIDAISLLRAVKFLSPTEQKKWATLSPTPLCVLQVTDVARRQITLNVYDTLVDHYRIARLGTDDWLWLENMSWKVIDKEKKNFILAKD